MKTIKKYSNDYLEILKEVFNSSTDAIMLLDKDGFFDCNPSTLKVFSIPKKSEFVKMTPAKLSPPNQPNGEDSLKLSKKMIDIAFKKGSNHFEWVHKKKNGENFPADVLITRFKINNQPVLQATVRDISEQKKVSQRLEEKISELEKMNRLMVNRELKMIKLKRQLKKKDKK